MTLRILTAGPLMWWALPLGVVWDVLFGEDKKEGE